MTRAVILGASGFIARELTRHLRDECIPVEPVGSDVVNLLNEDSESALASRLRADDSLVFTSALTPEHGRDEATLEKNLRMARHVCAALTAAPVAHVLYVSSDAVFADGGQPFTEDSPRSGCGLYGRMHAEREELVGAAAAQLGIPFCVVRPVAVFGSGDTHDSYGPNRFARSALRDRVITLFGEGEELREHIEVRDLVRLLSLCVTRRATGALNAATEQPVSFCELAQQVVRLCPHPVEVRKVPRAPGVAVTHRCFDIARLRRAFSDFQPAALQEGLSRMLRELTVSARA